MVHLFFYCMLLCGSLVSAVPHDVVQAIGMLDNAAERQKLVEFLADNKVAKSEQEALKILLQVRAEELQRMQAWYQINPLGLLAFCGYWGYVGQAFELGGGLHLGRWEGNFNLGRLLIRISSLALGGWFFTGLWNNLHYAIIHGDAHLSSIKELLGPVGNTNIARSLERLDNQESYEAVKRYMMQETLSDEDKTALQSSIEFLVWELKALEQARLIDWRLLGLLYAGCVYGYITFDNVTLRIMNSLLFGAVSLGGAAKLGDACEETAIMRERAQELNSLLCIKER